MLIELVRRQVSALLVSSILISAFEPAFAVKNVDDDGCDESVSETKALSLIPQKVDSAVTKNTADSNETKHPVFGLKPVMDCIFDHLDPFDAKNVGVVSKAMAAAKKRYDRTQMARVDSDDLEDYPSLTRKYARVIMEDRKFCVLSPDTVEKLDFSQLQYLDTNVEDYATLARLLEKVSTPMALLHLTVEGIINDEIERDGIIYRGSVYEWLGIPPVRIGDDSAYELSEDLEESDSDESVSSMQSAASFESALSDDEGPTRPRTKSSLWKLASIHLHVNNLATALILLKFFRDEFQINNQNDRSLRPYIRLFIGEPVTSYNEVNRVQNGDTVEVRTREVHQVVKGKVYEELRKKKEPTPEDAEAMRKYEMHTELQALITEFKVLDAFLKPLHQGNIPSEAQDPVGTHLREKPLLVVTSASDLRDGAVDDMDLDVMGKTITMLPFLKSFFAQNQSLEDRYKMAIELSTLQPSTLVNVIPLVQSIVDSNRYFNNQLLMTVEAVDVLITVLASLPEPYRAPALKATFSRELDPDDVLNGYDQLKTKILLLSLLRLFSPETHKRVAHILEPLLRDSIVSRFMNSHYVNSEKLEEVKTIMAPALEDIARPRRLAILERTVRFIKDRTHLLGTTPALAAEILKAYNVLPDEGSWDLLESSIVPGSVDPEFALIAGAHIRPPLREEVIRLIRPLLSNGLNWNNVTFLAEFVQRFNDKSYRNQIAERLLKLSQLTRHDSHLWLDELAQRPKDEQWDVLGRLYDILEEAKTFSAQNIKDLIIEIGNYKLNQRSELFHRLNNLGWYLSPEDWLDVLKKLSKIEYEECLALLDMLVPHVNREVGQTKKTHWSYRHSSRLKITEWDGGGVMARTRHMLTPGIKIPSLLTHILGVRKEQRAGYLETKRKNKFFWCFQANYQGLPGIPEEDESQAVLPEEDSEAPEDGSEE